MIYEIKRVNIWSVVKIVFIVTFIAGAMAGTFYALLVSLFNNIIQDFSNGEFDYGYRVFNVMTPFFTILFFAIFSSIANCLISVIAVLVYNVLAQIIGGIKIELNQSGNT